MRLQILAFTNQLVDLISVHLNFSVLLVNINVGAEVTVSIDRSMFPFFGIVLVLYAFESPPMCFQLGLNVVDGDGIETRLCVDHILESARVVRQGIFVHFLQKVVVPHVSVLLEQLYFRFQLLHRVALLRLSYFTLAHCCSIFRLNSAHS